MRMVYIGVALMGERVLKNLIEKGFGFEAIFTVSSEIVQRTHISGYTSYERIARKYSIPLYEVRRYDFKHPEDIERMRTIEPDLVIGFSWNRLLPKEILEIPKIGVIGAHAGHPPEGRGRAPIPWNIIKGFNDCFVYIFFMNADADAGDIIDMLRLEISPYDNALTVYDKFIICISQLLIKNIPLIERSWHRGEQIKVTPQDHSKAVYYPKRTPADGLIDFNQDVLYIYNWIRAQSYPYPGAFTYIRNRTLDTPKKVYIWEAIPFDRYIPFDRHAPGEVIAILLSGILVGTGSFPLLIKKASIEGSEVADAAQLAEQLNLQPGDIFGRL